MRSLLDFFKKFWLNDKYDSTVEGFTTLPLSNVVGFPLTKQGITPYSVEIWDTNGDKPRVIARDNGSGDIRQEEDLILDTTTGVLNTINYATGVVTVTWNPRYLNNALIAPSIEYRVTSEKSQEHVEMVNFLADVFTDYKKQELDAQLDYYNPERIPSHQVETMAKEMSWELDRLYSESESYLRRQLANIFNIYRSKRRRDGFLFAVAVIQKRVKLYNYLALRATTEPVRQSFYETSSLYAKMNTDAMLESISDPGLTEPQVAALCAQIEAIYASIYDETIPYYPIKHFLADLALDVINEDGTLLNAKDMKTLLFYITKIKAHTQYPHLTATLNVNSLLTLTEQDGSPFDFKLTPADMMFSVNSYENVTAGPAGVFSRAIIGTGAWALIPLLMNNQLHMNGGLIMNMQFQDVRQYIDSFRVGTGAYPVLTDALTDIQQPVLASNDVTYLFDAGSTYFICTLHKLEANGVALTELGLFNDQGALAFYMKFPPIIKNETHSVTFKIKLASVL